MNKHATILLPFPSVWVVCVSRTIFLNLVNLINNKKINKHKFLVQPKKKKKQKKIAIVCSFADEIFSFGFVFIYSNSSYFYTMWKILHIPSLKRILSLYSFAYYETNFQELLYHFSFYPINIWALNVEWKFFNIKILFEYRLCIF